MESIKSAAVFVGESGLGPWRGVGKEILFIVKSGQIRQPSGVRLRRLIPVGTLLDALLFAGIQFLSHEVMLVSGRMILKHPKGGAPQFFIKRLCLKTEGVKECIGASALDSLQYLSPQRS